MKVFHGSPMVDSDLNVYIQSSTGWVYSVTKDGVLRWSLELSDANPGNLALYHGAVYACSEDGVAWAIDAGTGKARWKQKIAAGCPDDTMSITAAKGLLFIPCTPINSEAKGDASYGNTAVCAVSAEDGTKKWEYALPNGTIGSGDMFRGSVSVWQMSAQLQHKTP